MFRLTRPNASFATLAFFATIVAPALSQRPLADPSPWVATWGTAMVSAQGTRGPDLSGQTLRLIVHTSLGGPQVRIWLSNRFGTTPLRVGPVHIAISSSTDPSAIQPATDRPLTFHHADSIAIPAGATVVSDPVALDIPALSNIAVSFYLPETSLAFTLHAGSNQTSYAATGNLVGAATLAGRCWPISPWYLLSGVDVYAPGASAIVALGDSTTDSNHSTVNANHRWPDDLATRLAADPATRQAGVLGVVNAGISGNRVLLDGDGPSAMSRLDADVFSRSGVRALILFEGINDIETHIRSHQPPGDLEQRLERSLSQIAERAHQHGIRVLGATQMTDCRNNQCAWPEGETLRQALNLWIRTSPVFDGVIDFDAATRDPEHPTQFLPQYNSGDSVHPNDAGYQAMADSINLRLLIDKK